MKLLGFWVDRSMLGVSAHSDGFEKSLSAHQLLLQLAEVQRAALLLQGLLPQHYCIVEASCGVWSMG